MLELGSMFDNVSFCYLCNKKFKSKDVLDKDHIIPDKFFLKDSPQRPKLPVHNICNNKKSIEDEWFIKQLQLRSSFNSEAEKEFNRMVDKAIREKPDAYIIGKKLHHYKLAKGIFNKITWGLEIKHRGQTFMQMEASREDYLRFQQYVETMCRGLFIYRIPNSKPSKPDLIMKQYAYLELKGKDTFFVDAIKNLINMSKSSKFGQQWGNRITYIGSRVRESENKGFLFIQFYSQFGILATFR